MGLLRQFRRHDKGEGGRRQVRIGQSKLLQIAAKDHGEKGHSLRRVVYLNLASSSATNALTLSRSGSTLTPSGSPSISHRSLRKAISGRRYLIASRTSLAVPAPPGRAMITADVSATMWLRDWDCSPCRPLKWRWVLIGISTQSFG